MTEILASIIIWLTGPVGIPQPPPPRPAYTCTTDAECIAECEYRGDTHCDDMMYGVGR